MFSLFKKMFGRQPEQKEKAAVFVDFENWAGIRVMHGLDPNFKVFFEDVRERFNISLEYIFGNFAVDITARYLNDLRLFTNSIVETKSSFEKKDYTDFIMLDYIYRAIIEHPEISTYILFTGDGHFGSVAKTLKTLGKTLILYGVKDATSNSLAGMADEVHLVPSDSRQSKDCTRMIISSLDRLARQNRITFPTFRATVARVAEYNGIAEDTVHAALQALLDKGLITQEIISIDNINKSKVLRPQWDKLKAAGLWEPDTIT